MMALKMNGSWIAEKSVLLHDIKDIADSAVVNGAIRQSISSGSCSKIMEF